ncbi:hypothetical protein, partial [Microbispora hainanensis]|uniref:hypothetical protein n=1 Tax=Microbispora hainanensis TaxID=568844 RepID=UPI001ABF929D
MRIASGRAVAGAGGVVGGVVGLGFAHVTEAGLCGSAGVVGGFLARAIGAARAVGAGDTGVRVSIDTGIAPRTGLGRAELVQGVGVVGATRSGTAHGAGDVVVRLTGVISALGVAATVAGGSSLARGLGASGGVGGVVAAVVGLTGSRVPGVFFGGAGVF